MDWISLSFQQTPVYAMHTVRVLTDRQDLTIVLALNTMVNTRIMRDG